MIKLLSLFFVALLILMPLSISKSLDPSSDEDNGIAPEITKVSYREVGGINSTYDEYTFTDGFGRTIQVKTEAENGKQIVVDTYYDEFGRVSRKTNPYFTTTSATYTEPNTTVSFTNYTYDVLDRTIKIINSDGTSNNATYKHWNITFHDENNNRIDHIYDAYQKIIQIREYNDGDVYVTNYDYDSADNLIKIEDNLFNNWTYNYDSLGRKISGVDPDTGVSNYTYDAVGNLISQSTGGGNLVTGDGFYREYDDFGRLKAIYEGSDNSSILEEYTYDGNGDRIKTYNAINNETTYTPFREFTMIVNESGIYNYTYIYDSTDTLVARINPDNSKWYYHADHLGSTTLITNQSGDIVENTFYLPYGAIDEGGNAEDKLYEGKELDDTGQYYYGSRYYNPETALFIQPDSIIPDVYDPQQLNIYAFERGNPYKYVDPTGNAFETFLDVGFIFYGLYKFISSPSFQTGAELALDIGFAAAPFVPNVKRIAEGVSALNKAGDVADAGKAADILQANRVKGIEGESKILSELGVGKNTKTLTTIDPKTGGTVRTIPDILNSKTGIAEIKNARSVSFTKQLRAQDAIARESGGKATLFTGQLTRVSRNVLERFNVIRRNFLG